MNTYAVLATSGITSVGTTTVTNGYYGSSPTATYTNISGTVDSTNAGTAQTNLTNFITSINIYVSGLTQSTIGTVSTAITFYPSINYTSASTITFQAIPIVFDAQGDSTAQFFVTAGTAFTFNNVPSITLINGASSCNIFWVAGSAISFTGTSPSSIPGVLIAGSAISFANASSVAGRLYAKTAVTFAAASSVTACTQTVVCYAKGTLILTKRGYVPIEKIKAGHKVITQGKIVDHTLLTKVKVEPVIWISSFTSQEGPICIQKNAFGENYPFQDLRVSPDHCLLIHGKMVRAKYLVNGTTIYKEKGDIVYYHLECEKHSAIVANGILSETYVDLDNRHVFEESERIQPLKFMPQLLK